MNQIRRKSLRSNVKIIVNEVICSTAQGGAFLNPYKQNKEFTERFIPTKKGRKQPLSSTHYANSIFPAFLRLVQSDVCFVEQFGESLDGAVCVIGDADAGG